MKHNIQNGKMWEVYKKLLPDLEEKALRGYQEKFPRYPFRHMYERISRPHHGLLEGFPDEESTVDDLGVLVQPVLYTDKFEPGTVDSYEVLKLILEASPEKLEEYHIKCMSAWLDVAEELKASTLRVVVKELGHEVYGCDPSRADIFASQLFFLAHHGFYEAIRKHKQGEWLQSQETEIKNFFKSHAEKPMEIIDEPSPYPLSLASLFERIEDSLPDEICQLSSSSSQVDPGRTVLFRYDRGNDRNIISFLFSVDGEAGTRRKIQINLLFFEGLRQQVGLH